MNKKSAPGQDNIPATFLAALGPQARQILLDIFNQSFNQGTLPQIWRDAIIIPLLKASKPASDIASFRPISLTSCVIKLFERMVVNRLVTMAETNNWFHRYQAGFRKGRNCTDQILRLVQRIDDGFQRGEKSVLALLDLSKAYDCVWRQKLIHVMYDTGVPPKFIRWISGFLENRQAKVRFNNAEGKTMTIKQGLPQGSVMAPILFLLYINTLAVRLPENTTNSIFADDVSILASSKSLQESEKILQAAVNIVHEWALEYKMELSTKSEVTFFSMSTRDASKYRPSVKIGEPHIKFEATPRLLGVYLDRTLSFNKHLDITRGKVNSKCRLLGAISNSEWGWKKKDLTKVYNSHVRSVLDYGAQSWQSRISETAMTKLEAANNRALRMITGQSKDSPIPSIQAEAGVTSYSTISKRNILIARERALRCSEDHPCRIAIEAETEQRLSIRHGFRYVANELSEYIPPEAEQRVAIDNTMVPSWKPRREIMICTASDTDKKKSIPDDLLRKEAITAIRDVNADWVVYTDGSASEGITNGESAAVITKGVRNNWRSLTS